MFRSEGEGVLRLRGRVHVVDLLWAFYIPACCYRCIKTPLLRLSYAIYVSFSHVSHVFNTSPKIFLCWCLLAFVRHCKIHRALPSSSSRDAMITWPSLADNTISCPVQLLFFTWTLSVCDMRSQIFSGPVFFCSLGHGRPQYFFHRGLNKFDLCGRIFDHHTKT